MNMEFLLSKHPHHQQVRFNTELQEQWLPLFRSPLNEGHLLTIFQLPQDHFSSLTCSVPASTSSTPTPHGPTVIKTHHWLEIFQQMTCSVPDKTFNGLSLNSILCIFSGFYLSTVKVLPKILSSALLPFSPLSSVSWQFHPFQQLLLSQPWAHPKWSSLRWTSLPGQSLCFYSFDHSLWVPQSLSSIFPPGSQLRCLAF